MSFRISLRLSDELYKKIQNMSDTLSDSLSDICRTAIEHFIIQYEQEKTNKKNLKIDKTFEENYINQLTDEINYLKDENIILRKKIDENISDINIQLETLTKNIEINKKSQKLKTKNDKLNHEKDLFITRM